MSGRKARLRAWTRRGSQGGKGDWLRVFEVPVPLSAGAAPGPRLDPTGAATRRERGQVPRRLGASPRSLGQALLVHALILVLTGSPFASGVAGAQSNDRPRVTAPPESFFDLVRDRDRDAARAFYRKCLDVEGMPVVAAAGVADLALERTRDIVRHMLAGRPDVVRAMVQTRMYLIIIGKDQVYTDMPE